MLQYRLMNELFAILHEDAELLVVSKPAGLVCHPTKPDGRSSLISRVRAYLGVGVTPRLVNRLDRETSGVVLVAKTAAVASELGKLFAGRAVEKEYLAIVHGHLREDHGLIDAPLGKDEGSAVAIKDCVRPDGAPAQTEFSVLQRFSRGEGDFSLLRVRPLTGRKHQIRIHLSHTGHPIVGDKIYGGDERLYLDFVSGRMTDEQRRRLLLPNHALHAAEIRFTWRGRELRLQAAAEDWFTAFIGCRAPCSNPIGSPSLPDLRGGR